MYLTSSQQREVARKAYWNLDCQLGTNSADPVVFTGDGVDDLNRTITILQAAPTHGSRFMIDLGTQYSSYHRCDVADLEAIRTFYIEFYGTVSKPDLWTPPDNSVAFPVNT